MARVGAPSEPDRDPPPRWIPPRALFRVPAAGIALFLLLFLVAAALYPGGHQADPTAPGFSLRWNYWSDLLRGTAINGASNEGQPVALAGLFTLVLSMVTFWWVVPAELAERRRVAQTTRATGSSGTLLTLFVFTALHDLVIAASALLVITATLLTLLAGYRRGERVLVGTGLASLALALAALVFWRSQALTDLAPVAQKVAIVACLAWVVFACERAARRS